MPFEAPIILSHVNRVPEKGPIIWSMPHTPFRRKTCLAWHPFILPPYPADARTSTPHPKPLTLKGSLLHLPTSGLGVLREWHVALVLGQPVAWLPQGLGFRVSGLPVQANGDLGFRVQASSGQGLGDWRFMASLTWCHSQAILNCTSKPQRLNPRTHLHSKALNPKP